MHTGVTGGSRAGQCRLAILCLALGSASAFSGAPSILNLGSCRGALLVRGSTCDKFVGGAAPRAMKGVLKIRAAASEWTEVKDEASGNVYFWNQETGETSWEQPAPRDVKAAAASGDNLASASPEGWENKFAGFFSSVGASPEQMGMARFDRNKFPELFPATLTEFAEPVVGDDSDVALFRPLLARTSLQKRPLMLVYDANRDGWDARAFHSRVDRLGPGLVLARTEKGAVLGGYNPKGWVGLGEYRGSLAAFLFTWPDGDTSKPAIKLRKVGGSSLACVDEPESGPRFGADGLHIPLRGDDAVSGALGALVARCKLGPYYERREDGSNSIFAPGEKNTAQLTELKVFVGVYAEGEEIPYDDALPFQLE